MTLLQVMPADAPGTVLIRTRDTAEITDTLRAHGVSFSRWPVRLKVTSTTTPADLLESYRKDVDALCSEQGLRLVDVARLHPEDGSEWAVRADAARSMFLEEHRHDEDEVRFFAHGTGCFYLRLDNQVHAVVCEAGDLLSVPAGTRHWFDMGPVPDFAAIRFFEKEDGWVGAFTADPIAGSFPRLDALLAQD